MNNQSYTEVINLIGAQLKVPSKDKTLIRNVIAYVKQLDIRRLSMMYPETADLYKAIAQLYCDSIKPVEKFDYERHLKAKLPKKDNSLTIPLTTWSNEAMPMISVKSMSIYLDSRARNTADSSPTDFVFMLIPRQTRSILGDGRIQVRDMPARITYFKLGKIILPYGLAARSNNFTKEITLTFTALRDNGIIAHNDTYHFAFTYTVVNDQLVELTPVDKYCKFSPPLRMVDNLTIRFNDPIYPIAFPIDRLTPASFNYLSSDGRIVFTDNHGLGTGDVIIISGLNTLDNSRNGSLLTRLHNPRGIAITKINDTTISTGIDFTTIASPDTNSLPTLLFYSRMFRFPIEIGHQDIDRIDL